MKLGVTKAAALEWIRENDPQAIQDFAIWRCNRRVLDIFMGLKTQWRRHPLGGVCGLEYSALPAYFQMRGIRRGEWPEIFDAIQVMECAALEVLNQR